MITEIRISTPDGTQPELAFAGEWLIGPGHQCATCDDEDLYNADRTQAFLMARRTSGGFVLASANSDYLLWRAGVPIGTIPDDWCLHRIYADAMQRAQFFRDLPSFSVEGYVAFDTFRQLADSGLLPEGLIEEVELFTMLF